ncbi:filamin A-interacting protein 1-like isoform X2 [Amborella trichopoda]|uniref:filamin A-interacting protein 1-like isoform X2 n=1 Tax=Amborella trichopoda TaxID=13333 RepID=UPI0009C142D2|nr:filamin A-interacting protein 1-like isoform X2 [Amborella trichopoda]|eukprot:XP_020527454.1 filamin A-interacting protein 1-like isoform X2 [Amborella trichopoda]
MEEGVCVTSASDPLSSIHGRTLLKSLIRLLKVKQSQLEFFADERKLLEERLKVQHKLWVSEIHQFELQISQMERALTMANFGRAVDMAKMDHLITMKEKEAHLCKLKLEYAESDLEDQLFCTNCLSEKTCDRQGHVSGTEKGEGGVNQGRSSSKKTDQSSNKLQAELRKLSSECEKLNLKKNRDVSALLLERNFVWDQMKRMEEDYIGRLKGKEKELELANETTEKFGHNLEKLQSTLDEKDAIVIKLKSDLAESKAELDKLNKELSRLSHELVSTKNKKVGSEEDLDICSLDKEERGSRRKILLVDKQADGLEASYTVSKKDNDLNDKTSKKDLIVRLNELSKQTEIMHVENEHLRMLCADLKDQLNKQNHPVKENGDPLGLVQRNLTEEMERAVIQDPVAEPFLKSCDKHKVEDARVPKQSLKTPALRKEEGIGNGEDIGNRRVTRSSAKRGNESISKSGVPKLHGSSAKRKTSISKQG